jgi:3D (Asp-Asp-Asp) domain-containing protein
VIPRIAPEAYQSALFTEALAYPNAKDRLTLAQHTADGNENGDGSLDRSEQAIDVRITAYDACPNCTGKCHTHPAFGITKLGTTATEFRTIAVDPKVIPLGSWVYIDGLGVYRAEDTGGSIKGYKVDLFMGSHEEAIRFGVKTAKVYFLAEMPEKSAI